MNNKVWIYVIGKQLSDSELLQLKSDGEKFVADWTAHEHKLSASFDIQHRHLIVVKVNEGVHNASGCSIDKLLRFVKGAGEKFGFNPTDRLLVAYKQNQNVLVTHASKIKELLAQGIIGADTVVLNTAVSSEAELAQWEQPLKSTWLSKYLSQADSLSN